MLSNADVAKTPYKAPISEELLKFMDEMVSLSEELRNMAQNKLCAIATDVAPEQPSTGIEKSPTRYPEFFASSFSKLRDIRSNIYGTLDLIKRVEF